jgi:hypothetical protein
MKPITALAIVLCSSAVFAQQPAWYATHTHNAYQPEQYILGVGTADGANAIEKAKKNAQIEIVSQIRVQVKGEMKNVSESYQIDRNESIASDFSSTSRSIVNEEIAGISIVETFVDPSTQTAYALAALDRTQYARTLSDEMNAAWDQSFGLRTSADDYLRRGKLSDALQNCSEARSLIAAALPKKALHDAVAGRAYAPPHAITPVSLTMDMRSMLSKVRIEKLGGDDQTGKIGSRFAVPMTVRVLYDDVPVSGAALMFETTDERTLSETATDGKGQASYAGFVRSLPGNTVRVKPALGTLAKEFQQSAASSAVRFTFAPQPSDIRLEIAVTGMKGQPLENVKAAFASAAGKIGYRVAPSSRYRLDVVLRLKPASKTEGLSGTLYTIQLETISTLMDKQLNASLGSLTSTAAGGGKTEAEAAVKASGSITIDRMKLAELIEKIQQQ